jgi:hypothetical protein
MKPDNVLLTRDGAVKVLDFGIAKALDGDEARRRVDAGALEKADLRLTREGALVGTLPYMSPEQCGMDTVDSRTDLWAIGLILWELITGRHPLAPVSAERMLLSASSLDDPMPRIASVVSNLPEALEQTIDGCLAKRKDQRIATAQELVERLEPLIPSRRSRRTNEDASPYVGLAAFQESDAGRFFGRSRDIARVVARVQERPLVAIAGPSGVGKSSFVRAGVIPALKALADHWETLTLRPGRDPISAIATLLQPMRSTGSLSSDAAVRDHRELCDRLRTEPGYLGTVLRARARQKEQRILLFVDQFEELYTLVPDVAERRAFAACLAAVADDSAAPLRVILSTRADFLDRVSESDRLVDEFTRGLVFLAPPDREGLNEALIQPLEQVGFRFESPAIVDDMLVALQATPGALPLLQFVASRLWDARDRERKLVTVAAYQAMGGIAGALAGHADEAVAQMSAEAQRFARLVFQRLVTPERTRAIVDAADLLALSPSRDEGQRVLEQLVQARLLIVQARGDADGHAVEIVHESLITGWPRLRRWLDESQEDSALLAQLQTTAKQWNAAGRPAGLLWRGDAAEQARKFVARSTHQLAERERAFLAEVVRLATRSARVRRIVIGAVMTVLATLVIAAIIVIATIRSAEKRARDQASLAETEAKRAKAAETTAKAAEETAKSEAEKARAAQQESADRLKEIEQKDQVVARGKEDLHEANAKLKEALGVADDARRKAESANETLKRVNAAQEAELKKLRKANRPF